MHDDTLNQTPDTAELAPHESAALRRHSRLERQARVGILRNVNDPPRPPPRRASLLARWPSLRSSRRAHASAVESAAQGVVARHATEPGAPLAPLPLRRAADGTVQAIDIAGLMASVTQTATDAPHRTPYAAAMRADGTGSAPLPAQVAKPKVLRAEAWIADDDDPAEDTDALSTAFREAAARSPEAPASESDQHRRRGLWIVLSGVFLALFILVLLPAWAAL